MAWAFYRFTGKNTLEKKLQFKKKRVEPRGSFYDYVLRGHVIEIFITLTLSL